MKDKKYKYVEDVMEEYIDLTDEQIEIPLLVQKANDKYEGLKEDVNGNVLKPSDAEDGFKIFMQLRKYEERKEEIREELGEVEQLLKEFLQFLGEQKISYEKKDDNKNKVTYLFWLEDDQVKCNR